MHLCDVFIDDEGAKGVLEAGHFVKDVLIKEYYKMNPAFKDESFHVSKMKQFLINMHCTIHECIYPGPLM